MSSSVTTLKDDTLESKYSLSAASTLYDIYRISSHILLTGYTINPECQQFLDENIDIPLEIPKIVNVVNTILPVEINPSFELIEDEENLLLRRLAIIFNISNMEYDSILKLWKTASKKVYNTIDKSIGKKIAIILDGD